MKVPYAFKPVNGACAGPVCLSATALRLAELSPRATILQLTTICHSANVAADLVSLPVNEMPLEMEQCCGPWGQTGELLK